VTAPISPNLEGHYAGIVSRVVAFVIDVVAILASFAIGGTILEYIAGVVLGRDVTVSDNSALGEATLLAWAFIAFAYPLAMSGRTLGMAAVGLRVVRSDGRRVGAGRAVIRVLTLPLSFAVFCVGILLIVLRADRRALHDLFADTAVVYAWDARAAHIHFLARR
jgi:uncharacterized RDD family membrane protein YckC